MYDVVVRDALARPVATGYAENISESGFLLVCENGQCVPKEGRLFVTIDVPNEDGETTHEERRACRIVRVHQGGTGGISLGVEFEDRRE